MENYDWPTTSNTSGELVEMFCYVDLRFNSGLTDRNFTR